MYLVGKIKYNDNMFECLYMYEKDIKSLYLKVDGIVTSGYRDIHGEISIYKNYIAQDICKDIQRFESYINSKGVNKETLVNSLGVNLVYTGSKNKTSFTITKLNNTDVVGLKVNNAIYDIDLSVSASAIEPRVDFVTITNDIYTTDLGDEIRTRSLDEIGIEKDITWLKGKEYKVLNKTSDILKLISILSKFKGIISYDTETTGLKINMFGQYGNKHRDKLIEINKELDVNSRYKVDELVGVCISIKENEGYYIPVKHKKFDNAFYDDKEKVDNLKQRLYNKYKNYSFKGIQKNMQRYVLNLDSYEDIPNDVLLMEALRDILSSTESKILAHNCAFDWKVNHLYSIDTNFTDDTLLMHQLVYKFKDGKTMNSGLKTLTKELLGIDQLDLHDFFLGYTEDDSGLNRLSKKRKKDTLVDFSYMDYEGTRAYAPADADLTLQVYNILIKDFMENHRDEEYLYVTELQVAHAIGYMEFYGLRIDEDKIENARLRTLRDKLLLEHRIRLVGGMVTDKEVELLKELDVIDVNGDKDALDKLLKECEEVFTHEIAGLGSSFNLGSAQQACKYFYEDLGIECPQEKPSVAKGVIKQLKKLKNEDGSNKYQVIHDYADYKEMDTQLSKFYTQLPNYMYPGGYIFASYGQISTNTGRMSCKRPNNQQLPKYVTSLVIPREDSVFMDADFSQIEYRTLVALANEPTLKEQFKDPDNDYHTMMAALMFAIDYAAVTDVLRSAAKGLNFGIPYGMGIRALAIMLTGNDSPESIVLAQERYEQYFENQPNVRAFFEKVKQDAKQSGFTSTFWGRKRYYNFLTADGKYSRSLESRALRQAGNSVVQGTAADIFKIAVARTWRYIRKNNLLGLVHISNLVHDEQLIEINVKELNVQRVLTDIINCMELNLEKYNFPPLFVGAGIGASWKDAKGKMAEIHPYLANRLKDESASYGLEDVKLDNAVDVLSYFKDRVYNYRKEVVATYLSGEGLTDTNFKASIGNLINLQFDYKLPDNIDTGNVNEVLYYRVGKFIDEFNLGIDVESYTSLKGDVVVYDSEAEKDELEAINELEDELDLDSSEKSRGKEVVDNNTLGINPVDVARVFGYCLDVDRNLVVLNMDLGNTNLKVGYIKLHTNKDMGNKGIRCHLIIDGNVVEYKDLLYGVNVGNLDLIFLDKKY